MRRNSWSTKTSLLVDSFLWLYFRRLECSPHYFDSCDYLCWTTSYLNFSTIMWKELKRTPENWNGKLWSNSFLLVWVFETKLISFVSSIILTNLSFSLSQKILAPWELSFRGITFYCHLLPRWIHAAMYNSFDAASGETELNKKEHLVTQTSWTKQLSGELQPLRYR